jgi:hypothetical protein
MSAQAELNQEALLPNEVENTERLIEHEIEVLRERYARGDFLRDFHSKTHGGLKAKLVVEPNLAPEFRYGVFSEPRTWPTWVRFSNGGETVVPDRKGDVRGMAIKLMGVRGEKLLEREKNATTQDFIFFTARNFFAPDAFGFFEFIKVVHSKRFPRLKLAWYALTHLKVFRIILGSLKPCPNLLEVPFFSATPYLLGTRAVKYSLKPCWAASSEVPSKSEARPNYLRERLINDLALGEARFDFLVQFQADPVATPIEDASVIWDPAVAPFHKVATLVIPSQDFDTPERQQFTENLSMNPWHCLPEHRPLGNVNRTRKRLYDAISEFRHQMNEQPREEPTAGADFFDV